MFIGDFSHSLDDKCRLIMPSKFREELGSDFIITKGFEKCLYVYTEQKWKSFTDSLDLQGITKKEARKAKRFFCGNAMNAKYDKQGRFTITADLLNHAEINKEVKIIGVSDRIEIWSVDKWDEYMDLEFSDLDELSDQFEDLNL